MPRLRRSAGTATFAAASKNLSLPTSMLPCSGVWKPAIDMSVVDFPHPDGPSSVKSSPSATVKLTSSRARWSPNSFTRLWTWISGTVLPSRDADVEHLCTDREHDHRDDDLHERESRDRPDEPLDELGQHRRPHDLRPRLHEEHARVVVVDDLDEEQDERCEDRRLEQRQHDRPARAPPVRAGGATRPVEFLPDPCQRRIHDDVRE